MSIRNLAHLFQPKAIAVIGATNTPRRVGHIVIRNLLAGGFNGPIMPVNPKHAAVGGVLAYRDIESLPVTPDLAVIATPPATIPGIVNSLGRRGARAAIVLGGSLDSPALLAAARPYELRILGPNSLGILVPAIGLNASFAHIPALPGKVAFVSQSGALCAAVLDWAQSRGIGFSHCLSLGQASDVDFGDVMDYLARDLETRAILLYIEDIRERRNFMSAGRAAARSKPVLVVKANRFSAEEAIPSAFASSALAKPDDVFDAALRRAGMLRVDGVDEMFAAVETLARARPIRGDRLLVLTNGGGTGTMAADVLLAGGGRLATLSPSSVAELDRLLPGGCSRQNPVDIRMDASGDRYAAVLKVLIKDPAADAVLVTYAPTSLTPPEDPARAVVQVAKESGGNILTSWAGEATVLNARRMFAEAGIPTYYTPGRAVRAFLHMVNYHQNQEMLLQTPPSASDAFSPSVESARAVIQAALAEGRSILTEPEAKAVLSAYGLCMVEIRIVASIEQAARAAEQIGFPVALTIVSPAVTARWDVGGVALNLQSAEAVGSAAAAMLERLRQQKPDANAGFTVRPMVSRHNARQLIIGIASDRVFGPVILFGEGGRSVEIIRDHAIALPPLNAVLARELISRTRISRLLGPYLDRPAANIDSLCTVLIQVSQMIVDLPEIVEASLNPVFVNEKGVTVADCLMRVAPFTGHEAERLAIRPYPKALEESATLPDGRILMLRPIRPEDEPALSALMGALSPEDIRFRFFAYVSKPKPSQMARFTQIDYEREMAFVATTPDGAGVPAILGVVQSVADSDNQRAEFSIIVRPELRGTGLARRLLEKMIRYCRETGIAMLVGEVLSENYAMLRLAEKMGFSCQPYLHGETGEVRLNLQPPATV